MSKSSTGAASASRTGTAAFTNALKQVFYIHKDSISELKSKLDLVTEECARLKMAKGEGKNQSSTECPSCCHLRDLNRTLEEQFHSRIKDKNAIIGHLERRLKAVGEVVDQSQDEEFVRRGAETPHSSHDVETTHASKSTTRLNKSSSGLSNGQKNHEAVPVSVSDLEIESRTCSPKRQLIDEGKQHINQELQEIKRQRISSVSGDVELQKSAMDSRYVGSEKRNMNVNNSLLVPETEAVVDGLQLSKSIELDEDSSADEDSSSQEFLTIPETLGMHLANDGGDHSVASEMDDICDDEMNGHPNHSDTYMRVADNDCSDHVKSGVKHIGVTSTPETVRETSGQGVLSPRERKSLQEKSLVTRKTVLDDVETCTSSSKNKHVDDRKKIHFDDRGLPTMEEKTERPATTPNKGDFGSLDTPESRSPRIFDRLKIKKSDNARNISETPKQRVCKIFKKSVSNGEFKLLQESPAGSNITERDLKQTTLSQAFNPKALQAKIKNRTINSLKEEDIDEEEKHQIEQAIIQSLQDIKESYVLLSKTSPTKFNPTIPDPEFQVEQSPTSCKSPLTKRRAEKKAHTRYRDHTGENEGQVTPDHAQKSPNRNTHLLKLKKSPTNSTSRKSSVDSKNVVVTQTSKSSSRNLSKNYSVSVKEKLLVTEEEEGDESRPSSSITVHHHHVTSPPPSSLMGKSGDTTGARRSRDGRELQPTTVKGNGDLQLHDLNGSVNPDIHISQLLDSEVATMKARPGKGCDVASVTLDETIAPTLLSRCYNQGIKGSTACKDSSHEVSDDDVDDNDDDNDKGEDEIIAPSPQQNLHGQISSQTQWAIPSSSRSFKFTHKMSDPLSTSLPGGKYHAEESVKENVPCMDADMADDGHEDNSQKDYNFDHDVSNNDRDSESEKDLNKQLCDSFDRVQGKDEPLVEYAHVEVVRKKNERKKLQGFSCRECSEYYNNAGLSDKEIQQKMQECSRHRAKFRPPSTPEHFWSLGFPDTVEAVGHEPVQDQQRAPRRRRPLEKKF